MGSTSFLGFPALKNLVLVFLNILFRKCWDFLCFVFFSVPYFGLACGHGNLFLCLEE